MAKEYIERDADGFKYYVVRNKETGLYFRGKGENKWGKYYNQASVYRIKKHAENAVEAETRRGNPTEVVEIHITEAAADVVEVKHGYWDDNIIGFCNVCMECGAIVERTAIKNKSGELNYCPMCSQAIFAAKES